MSECESNNKSYVKRFHLPSCTMLFHRSCLDDNYIVAKCFFSYIYPSPILRGTKRGFILAVGEGSMASSPSRAGTRINTSGDKRRPLSLYKKYNSLFVGHSQQVY